MPSGYVLLARAAILIDKSILQKKSVDESSQAKCQQKLVYEPWCDNPDSAGGAPSEVTF